MMNNNHKLLIAIFGAIPSLSVFALPQGGQIIAGDGNAQISTPTSSKMVINQTSNKAVINWQSFNIDAGELVNFIQPNSSAVAINRISSASGPSQIHGTLKANGQIFLLNSAGILFGPSSRVDVGGIVASTLDLNMDAYRLDGRIQLIPNTTAASGLSGIIKNEGTIDVDDLGLAAFIAPHIDITNTGTISANLGHVQLSSGDHFTVDLFGDNLINFTVPDQILNPDNYSIEQNGKIYANGGSIILSAPVANRIVSNAISMDGLMEANSVGTSDGKIILNANENGFLTFSSKSETYAASGHVKAMGGDIVLEPGSLIDVSSVTNNTNAGEVSIGGNANGALLSEGDFNAKTVLMNPNTSILANADLDGNGGKVVVWSKDLTGVAGTLHAKGGQNSGSNGTVQVGGSGIIDTTLADIFPTNNIPNPTDPTNPGTGTGGTGGTTTPPTYTQPSPPNTGNNDKLDSLPPSTGNQITNNSSTVNHSSDAQQNQSSNTSLSGNVNDHTSNVQNNEGSADNDGDGYPDNVISNDGEIQPFEFSTGGASDAE